VLDAMVEAVEQKARRVGDRGIVVVVDLLEPRRLPLPVRKLSRPEPRPPVGAVLHAARDLQSHRIDPDRVAEVAVDAVEMQVRGSVIPVVRLVFLPLPQIHRPAVDRLMTLGRVHDDRCHGRWTRRQHGDESDGHQGAADEEGGSDRRSRQRGAPAGLRWCSIGKTGLSTIVLFQEEHGAVGRPRLSCRFGVSGRGWLTALVATPMAFAAKPQLIRAALERSTHRRAGRRPRGLRRGVRDSTSQKGSVTLVEQQNVLGGNAGSFLHNGIWLDYGSHRLHSACDPAILADIQALLGDDFRHRVRHGRIRLRGKWLHFPIKATDLLLHLDKGFALGMARDLARKAVLGKKPEGETFASVLQANLGPTMCEHFYFPYARKLWGREPAELSGIQARKRVTAGSFGKLVKRLIKPPAPACSTTCAKATARSAAPTPRPAARTARRS
jgi:hypothetical protein